MSTNIQLIRRPSWVNTSPGIWKKDFTGSDNPVLLDSRITKGTSSILQRSNEDQRSTQSNSSSDDETEEVLSSKRSIETESSLKADKRSLVSTTEELLTIGDGLEISSAKKVPGCLERFFSCIFPRKV